jgi:hypothetical protein
MTEDELVKLKEMSRLLDKAYDHYFSYEGHCKSYEGSIELQYGTYWDRQENPADLKITGVHIRSYVFCRSGRDEFFDSVDEALAEITKWYEEEMSYDPHSPEALENNRLMDEMAADFITNMTTRGRLEIIKLNDDF